MIRRDLLTIILRLGIGFIVLALLGFFLWNRVRKAPSPAGPTPTPTSVTIVTPTPTPTPTTLPTIGPDLKTPVPSHGGKDGQFESQERDSHQNRTYIKRTYVIETYTYTTEKSGLILTDDYGASAHASASVGQASASASATSGY